MITGLSALESCTLIFRWFVVSKQQDIANVCYAVVIHA